MQNRIAEIRKRRHIKQKELAAMLDMKVDTLGTWERGKNELSFADACHIADILECTLDELAGRDWPQRIFIDRQQEALNRDYELLDDEGRRMAAASVHGMAAAALRGEVQSEVQSNQRTA